MNEEDVLYGLELAKNEIENENQLGAKNFINIINALIYLIESKERNNENER